MSWNLNTRVSNLEFEVNGIYADISGIVEDISGLSLDLSGVKVDVENIQSDISGIVQDISGLSLDLSGVKVDVENIQADIVDIQNELDNLGIDTTFLTSDLLINSQPISSLNQYMVSDETGFNNALNNAPNYSVIIADTSFTITTTKTISKPLFICGTSNAITISSPTLVNMFNVDSDNVYFLNLTFNHNKTTNTSVESIITSSNYRNNLVISNCKFYCNEFSLLLRSVNIFIKGCYFSYSSSAPVGNTTYRAIGLYNCVGVNYILNNIFDGSFKSGQQAIFQSQSNVSDYFNGSLVIKGNTTIGSLRNFINFEYFGANMINFKLYILNNSYNSTSTDVLFFGFTDWSPFNTLVFQGNTTSSILATGSKGYISLDRSVASAVATGTLANFYASNNSGIQANTRVDYTYDLITNYSTAPNYLVGYRTAGYTNPTQFSVILDVFSNLPPYNYGNLTSFSNIIGCSNINAYKLVSDNLESNTSILKIGDTSTTTSVNIGSGAHVSTVNIGMGVGLTTINIGTGSDVVNIAGTLNYIQSTDLKVNDKNFILNAGASGSGTSASAGMSIRDNNIDNQGYFQVSSTNDYYQFKAPGNNFIMSQPVLTQNVDIIVSNDSRLTNSRQCNNNFDNAATSRTNLGLGSMAVQNDSSVSITGGSISGLSSLATLGNVDISGSINLKGDNRAITFDGNQLEIKDADGTPTITILDGGNVGIGTATPQNQLTIEKNGTNLIRFNNPIVASTFQGMWGYDSAGNNLWINYFNSAQNYEIANRYGNLQFYANSSGSLTERMRITSGGNVGINCVPQTTFEIGNNFGVNNALNSYTDIYRNTFFNGTNFINENGGASSLLRLYGGSAQDSSFRYYTSSSGTADASGNTITFTERLNINKTSFNLLDNAGSIRYTLPYALGSNGELRNNMTIGYVPSSKHGIYITNEDYPVSPNNPGAVPTIQGVSNSFGTRNIALQPGGSNVGIGTTQPTYKLDVSGDTNISANCFYRVNGIAQFVNTYINVSTPSALSSATFSTLQGGSSTATPYGITTDSIISGSPQGYRITIPSEGTYSINFYFQVSVAGGAHIDRLGIGLMNTSGGIGYQSDEYISGTPSSITKSINLTVRLSNASQWFPALYVRSNNGSSISFVGAWQCFVNKIQ